MHPNREQFHGGDGGAPTVATVPCEVPSKARATSWQHAACGSYRIASTCQPTSIDLCDEARTKSENPISRIARFNIHWVEYHGVLPSRRKKNRRNATVFDVLQGELTGPSMPLTMSLALVETHASCMHLAWSACACCALHVWTKTHA